MKEHWFIEGKSRKEERKSTTEGEEKTGSVEEITAKNIKMKTKRK